MSLFEQSIADTVRQMRTGTALVLFVGLPTLAGFQEGIPLLGFGLGVAFLVYIVVLASYFGI